jgi:uncharacterized protein (TIGR04222 family)
MFPFNLPGPQFLFFYALFAFTVIAAFYFVRRHYESGPPPSLDLVDPFLFACLRGGPKEVLSVAVLGLIDRDLLKVTGRTVTRSPDANRNSCTGASRRSCWPISTSQPKSMRP